MNTLLNALGLSVTVFISQKWDEQVASHTKIMLIIRPGKQNVSKKVEKKICETAIARIKMMVAKRKKRLWSLVIAFNVFRVHCLCVLPANKWQVEQNLQK